MLAQGFNFLLRCLELFRQLRDAIRQILGLHLELAGHAFYQGSFLGVVTEGIQTGVGLDAASTRANGGLTQHGYRSDFSGGTNVGTAAELDGERSADFYYADFLAVVLTE